MTDEFLPHRLLVRGREARKEPGEDPLEEKFAKFAGDGYRLHSPREVWARLRSGAEVHNARPWEIEGVLGSFLGISTDAIKAMAYLDEFSMGAEAARLLDDRFGKPGASKVQRYSPAQLAAILQLSTPQTYALKSFAQRGAFIVSE